MNCDRVEHLLDAYLDGELDLVTSLELEEHLPTCEHCQNAYANQKSLRRAFKSNDLTYSMPQNLEKRVLTNIAKDTGQNTRFVTQPRLWFGTLAAALILIAYFAFSANQRIVTSPSGNAILQEVLDSHVRSLMANHLADVASTSQHTVKPWFAGKLDFSPPVNDLADQGFPLIGGRLDYLDHRPVAALIYRHQKHFINLFIWPTDQTTPNVSQELTEQGYHLAHWTDSEMTYWAVSDMNEGELHRFAQLAQKANASAAKPNSEQ